MLNLTIVEGNQPRKGIDRNGHFHQRTDVSEYSQVQIVDTSNSGYGALIEINESDLSQFRNMVLRVHAVGEPIIQAYRDDRFNIELKDQTSLTINRVWFG